MGADLTFTTENAPVSKCFNCGNIAAPVTDEDWENDVRTLFHTRCYVGNVWGPNKIVEKPPEMTFTLHLTNPQVKHLKAKLGLKKVSWNKPSAVMHDGRLLVAWAIPAIKNLYNKECWVIVVQRDDLDFDHLRLFPERGEMRSVTFPVSMIDLAPWTCASCGSRDLLSFWSGGDWEGRVETKPLPTTDNPMGIVAQLLGHKTPYKEHHIAVNISDFAEVLIWYSSVLSMHAQQRDLHDALHAAVPGWEDMNMYVQLMCDGNTYTAYFVSPTQVMKFRWVTG